MITKVKWKEHNILGNLELDFTKSPGIPYSTIVFAGENGSGKTTILNTLSDFLNLSFFTPFDFIEYNIDGNLFHIYSKDETNAHYGFHERTNLMDSSSVHIHSSKAQNVESIKTDLFDIRHYGFAYSKARSGFNTKKVTSTTTQQLDQKIYENDDIEDFTLIKQLIVDIDEQDNSAWMKSCKNNENVKLSDFKSSSKLFRFQNAFNNFYDKLCFEGVDNNSIDEKKIIFDKSGNKINIDNLSTGEKQIVFRGAHLLKNVNSMSNSIILIDEPELSMHPRWQEKILNFYRNLFTYEGVQSAQIIIATHSEYVLRSALKDKDNVLIIVLKEKDGKITSQKIDAPGVLPSITAAETNFLAFGIYSIDYHIELYGYVQTKFNKSSIKSCDNLILHHRLYDSTQYFKPYSYNNTTYSTLPTYIRNAIDHPTSDKTFSYKELQRSIDFLIQILRS